MRRTLTPREFDAPVRAFAPATIANVGPGFDALGIALEAPGDVVTARRARMPGLTFRVRRAPPGLPRDGARNVAAHVARRMLADLAPPFGLTLVLDKRLPIGSGLGSSAASGVAAAMAVNALLPRPLPRRALLAYCIEGERLASGSPHADNAAPALLGGVCLVRGGDPLDVIEVPARGGLVWIVARPHMTLRTSLARQRLPKRVPLARAVQQWANLGGLLVGLMSGDAALTGRSIEDVIVEPARASLIPGFAEVKRAALDAGGLGCSIAGAGPSVFAIARPSGGVAAIGRGMRRAFRRHAGLGCDIVVSRLNRRGARLLHGARA